MFGLNIFGNNTNSSFERPRRPLPMDVPETDAPPIAPLAKPRTLPLGEVGIDTTNTGMPYPTLNKPANLPSNALSPDMMPKALPTPLRPDINESELVTQPYGVNPSKIGTETPDFMDPVTRAKLQVGFQPQKRSWGRVLADVAQGFFGGRGTSDAINQGINGSKIRYENDLNQAIGQNQLQDQYKRVRAADALNRENILADNERQKRQIDYNHQEAMAKLNARPTANYKPHTVLDRSTNQPLDLLYDENTGATKPFDSNYGHYEKAAPIRPLSKDAAIARYLAAHPEKMNQTDQAAKNRAEEYSALLQTKGNEVIKDGFSTGKPPEYWQQNDDARAVEVQKYLHSLGIKPSYDPTRDPEAQAELAAYMRGEEFTPQQRTLPPVNNGVNQSSATVDPIEQPSTPVRPTAPTNNGVPVEQGNNFNLNTPPQRPNPNMSAHGAARQEGVQPFIGKTFKPEQISTQKRKDLIEQYRRVSRQPGAREKFTQNFGFDPGF